VENLQGKDHLEDQTVDGKLNIIMDLREMGWEGVDWMHLAQDRAQWQALVNMIMDLWVP
jgi:hypothetical protein